MTGDLDSSIVLFHADTATEAITLIRANDNASAGFGSDDGSISTADSYLKVKLAAGQYRVAVSASGLTTAQAATKQMPSSLHVRICDERTSNYGNYRLTLSTSATVTMAAPGSYIGSQCNVASSTAPYKLCSYRSLPTLLVSKELLYVVRIRSPLTTYRSV